jgi:Tol biopolymer transport system component
MNNCFLCVVMTALLVLTSCTTLSPIPSSTPTLTPVVSTSVPSQTPTTIPPLEGKIIFSIASPTTEKYYIYDLTNHEKSELGDFPCGLGLSSDHRKVAFFNTDLTLIQMDIYNGETKELLSLNAETHTCGEIAWSPDNSKIAYISNGDLYVLQVASGQTTLVAQHREGDYVSHREGPGIRSPTWTSDGKTILFDDFTAPFMYSSPPGPEGYRAIFALNSIDDGSYDEGLLGLHDGQIVAQVPNREALEIRVYTEPDKSSASILSVINEDGTESKIYPIDRPHAWSSDGNEVAYLGPKIFIVDISSREKRDLRGVGRGAQDITWSPDHNHLAVIEKTGPIFLLYAVDTATSYQTRISTTPVPGESAYASILAWIEP